jgi:hypothetical protein
MAGKAQKSHWARSELNFVFSLEKVDRWKPIRTSAIQSRCRAVRFLGFSNHEKGSSEARNFEVIIGLHHVFEEWSVVRSASLAKGGTSKRRPSPHLHKVPSRSNKSANFALVNFRWSIFYLSLCHAVMIL